MLDQKGNARGRAQIALEFMIVYSFVLVLFVLMFTLVSTQRAASMSQQEYSLLQLQAQNIADYINQAIGAGSGYAATIPISGSIGAQQFNVSISTTGVVIAQTKVGTQIIRAYAFSTARNLVINGTQTQSGNGITVYKVPIQMGNLYLTNSNGAIYVDMLPPSTLGLAKSTTLTNIANTKVIPFNTINNMRSYNLVSGASTLPNGATLSAWVKYSSVTSGCPTIVFVQNSLSNNQRIGIDAGCNNLNAYFFTEHPVWPSEYGATAPTSAVIGRWYHLVGVYNSVTDSLYMNGAVVSSTTVPNTILGYGSSAYVLVGDNFNGFITNIQVYNMPLSANQVASLYSEGISGAPISSANIIGWWPLNGNTNDYSGNGNNGVPSSPASYQTVSQINAFIKPGTGANTINTIMGFVTSNGVLGANGNSLVLYTNATGGNTLFVSSNGVKGIANLTINTFNDNITTVGNLVGWWPLDEGYGSIAYDLSGQYNNGAFSTSSWVPFANQTNLAVASFNGINSNINMGVSNALDVDSGPYTISAWIYLKNLPSSIWMTLMFKGNPNYGSGYGLDYGFGYFDLVKFGVMDQLVAAPLTINTWYHVVAVQNYASTTPTNVTVYLNGINQGNYANTQAYSSSLGWNTYIGGGSTYSGAEAMNGLISDVQLYRTALTSSQAMQLYKEGISGSPIGDAGLVSWWPLAYGANDFASTGDNGAPTNVVFNNVNYINPTTNTVMKVASFNSASSSYINIGNPTQLQITGGITACAWVNLNSNAGKDEILSKWDSSGQLSYSMAYDQPDGVYFAFWISTTGSDAPYAYSGSIATSNKFYFVCGVYNTHTISLFLNGVNSTHPQTQSGTIFNGNSNFRIGYGPPGSGYFNGQIADVQIYNSVLTATQILQMYQQGLPLYSKMNVSLG